MHPDMAGQYEVDDSVVCNACAAEDEYHRTHKDMAPGTVLRVIDTDPGLLLDPWDPDEDQGDDDEGRPADDVPDETDALG